MTDINENPLDNIRRQVYSAHSQVAWQIKGLIQDGKYDAAIEKADWLSRELYNLSERVA